MKYKFLDIVLDRMIQYGLVRKKLKVYDNNLKLLINSKWPKQAKEIWKNKKIRIMQLTNEALSILNDAKYKFNADYLVDIFNNKELLKSNGVIEAAQKLNNASNEKTANYIYNILTKAFLIKNNLNINYAELLLKAKEEYMVEFAYYLLIDENLHKLKLSKESAKIIFECRNENIAEFTYEVLSDSEMLKRGISIQGARIVQNAKDEVVAFNTCNLLTNLYPLDNDQILEIAKLMQNVKLSLASEIIGNLFDNTDEPYKLKLLLANIVKRYDNEFKLNLIDKILNNKYYYTKNIICYLVLIVDNIDIEENMQNIKNVLDKDYEEFILELTKDVLFFKKRPEVANLIQIFNLDFTKVVNPNEMEIINHQKVLTRNL